MDQNSATPANASPQARQQRPQSSLYTILVCAFDVAVLATHVVILSLYFSRDTCLTMSTWLIINAIRVSLLIPHTPLKWFVLRLAANFIVSIQVRRQVQFHRHEHPDVELFARFWIRLVHLRQLFADKQPRVQIRFAPSFLSDPCKCFDNGKSLFKETLTLFSLIRLLTVSYLCDAFPCCPRGGRPVLFTDHSTFRGPSNGC